MLIFNYSNDLKSANNVAVIRTASLWSCLAPPCHTNINTKNHLRNWFWLKNSTNTIGGLGKAPKIPNPVENAKIISKNLTFSRKADIYYRLKRLIDKNQMGDLFKVMLVTDKRINFNLGFWVD